MASIWQSARLFEDTNSYILENGILSDVTFLAGKDKVEVKAHKVILASRSPVFYCMFCGSVQETSDNILIPDIEEDILKELLRFVYTEQCHITHDTVTGLMYAANKYELQRLVEKCTDYLKAEMSVENVCVILMHAHQFNLNELTDKCFKFIFTNVDAVLKHGGINCLSKEVLRELLQSDYLCADELDIYKACKDWAVANLQGNKDTDICHSAIREKLGDLLFLIRFPLIDPDKFAHQVSNENILSPDEKLSVFRSFFENTKIDQEFLFCKSLRRKQTEDITVVSCKSLRRKQTEDITVVRFEDFRIGWHNSSQLYGINFKVSKSAMLVGVSMFTPSEKGTIEGFIRLQEGDDVLILTDIALEFQDNIKFKDIRFEKAITLTTDRTYTVVQCMRGTRSFTGENGQTTCFCEHLGLTVTFSDCTDRKISTSMATTVTRGQINGLIFGAI